MNKYQRFQEDCIKLAKQKSVQMKNQQSKKGFIANSFYHYAEEFRKNMTDEKEIEKIDMTELFWTEMFTIPQVGEIINVNINAPPTSGKSLTGFSIASEIMPVLFKKGFSTNDIDRDQQEFSITMRNPDIKNTIRVIDEWNELETTGENSSVEEALLNHFSDVMAQRFVHKISCSPTASADKNALIYLEVFSTDKLNFVNHSKLFYRLYSGGIDYRQLIGRVSIYTGNILGTQWYKDYRRRKFEKMELILKEGIYRPRTLEYAFAILETINHLKPLVSMTSLVNMNLIKNYIRIEFENCKIPLTILGLELATQEAHGVLDLYKGYYKMIRDIDKELNRRIDLLRDNDTLKLAHQQTKVHNLVSVKDELGIKINHQIDRLKRYIELHKKYHQKLR